MTEEFDGEYYYLTDGTVEMLLITPNEVAELLEDSGRRLNPRNLTNTLVNVIDEFANMEAPRSEIDDISFEGEDGTVLEGVGWAYEIDSDFEGIAALLALTDADFLICRFLCADGRTR